MSRNPIAVALATVSILALIAGASLAQDPPRRLEHDEPADAELDCFECTRGDLLTFDARTGKVTRRPAPPGVADLLHLLSEGGEGALAKPGLEEALKDFGVLVPVLDATGGNYPKHVKIFSHYIDEHGHDEYTSCSGTMIDPFHVLTAGHCVYMHTDDDGDDVYSQAVDVKVIPAYYDGEAPFGEAHHAQLHVYDGWADDADYDWDVALIDLEWPIGALTGWRNYGSNPNCSWFTDPMWTHYGYPGESYGGEQMHVQSGTFDGCEGSGNEVWFDRETFRGQSGGGAVRDGAVYAVRSNLWWIGPDDWDTYDACISNTMFYDIQGWIDGDTPSTFDIMPLTITAPDTLVEGEYCTFSFLLHNYSSAQANGSWPLTVYLSDDDVFTFSDDDLEAVTISAVVNPKSTVTQTVGFPVSCSTNNGPAYLGVHVQAGDADFHNDWTQPWHAKPIVVVPQPAPPVPDPYSPPDYTLCCDTGSVPLLWTDSGGNSIYHLQLGTAPGEGPVVTTTTNYYTATGLQPGTNYYWRVASQEDCSAWSDWSDVSWFRTEYDPGLVTSAVAPADSAHCVTAPLTLQWDPLPGADTYDVRISSTWCYEGDVHSGVQNPSLTLTELDPGATYYWAVRAHTDCAQITDWSSAQQFCFTFQTAPDSVGAPSLIVPEDGSTCESAATGLLWSHVAGYDFYDVQVDTVCGSGPIQTTGYNGFPLTGLESETTYYWRVRTHHECGIVGDWSPCRSFSLDLVPPLNPTTVSSSSHALGVWSRDNTIDTSWDFGYDACENAMTDYGWVFDLMPGTEPSVVTSEMPEFTYTTSAPVPDGEVWFHLRAVDQAGNWAMETLHLGTFLIDASQPSQVELEPVCLPVNLWGDFGTLEVAWAPAEDATSGVAGYSYALVDGGAAEPDTTVDATDTSASLPLTYGSWNFAIVAVDRAGNTGRPTEAGTFLNDPSLPAFSTPTPCQVTAEGELLQLAWEPVSRVVDGSLHFSDDGGATFTQTALLTGAEVEGGVFDWIVPTASTDEAVLRLDVHGTGGDFTAASPLFSVRTTTDVAGPALPEWSAVLAPNYPNPFNPGTTVVYEIGAGMRARVRVIDAMGRHVRTLVDWRRHEAGRHEAVWRGTDDRGVGVSSGLYFSCLETSEGRMLRRMTLVK